MNFDEKKLEIGTLKINRNASLLMAVGFGFVIANIGNFETINTVPFVLYASTAIAHTAVIYKLKKKQEGIKYLNPLSATLEELKSKVKELKLERNSALINVVVGLAGAGVYPVISTFEEKTISGIASATAFLAAGLMFGKEATLYHAPINALKEQCSKLQNEEKRKSLK